MEWMLVVPLWRWFRLTDSPRTMWLKYATIGINGSLLRGNAE